MVKIKQMSPQLLVSNLENSIQFYTKSLGYDLDFRYEDFYAGISKDGHSIHLKIGKPSVEERSSKKRNQDLDIFFSVDRIENLFEEFKTKSIPILQPLRTMEYGQEFYITDPDGYILGFVEAN